MEKYKDMSLRKRSNIKMLRNLFFFLLLIGFTFWFVLKNQDINELFNTIKSVDLKCVLISILLMLMVYLTESFNIRCILQALGEKRLSIFKALKFTWIGFFFSAITPAATGGQPVEIYYMNKEGISSSNATMAMMLQLCGFQISTLLISIICVIIYPSVLSGGIIWFFILGLVLNVLVLTFMFVGIFLKKITKKLVDIFIKLLALVRIRNLDRKKVKFEEGLAQYNKSANFIKAHKAEFFKSIVRVFVQVLFLHSIPFFVYKAFGLTGYSYMEVLSIQAILYIMVCSIPLPGSIGVSERLFLKLFGGVFGELILSSAMLINRFVSFYLYILISAIVVIVNAVRMKNVTGEIDNSVKEVEAY